MAKYLDWLGVGKGPQGPMRTSNSPIGGIGTYESLAYLPEEYMNSTGYEVYVNDDRVHPADDSLEGHRKDIFYKDGNCSGTETGVVRYYYPTVRGMVSFAIMFSLYLTAVLGLCWYLLQTTSLGLANCNGCDQVGSPDLVSAKPLWRRDGHLEGDVVPQVIPFMNNDVRTTGTGTHSVTTFIPVDNTITVTPATVSTTTGHSATGNLIQPTVVSHDTTAVGSDGEMMTLTLTSVTMVTVTSRFPVPPKFHTVPGTFVTSYRNSTGPLFTGYRNTTSATSTAVVVGPHMNVTRTTGLATVAAVTTTTPVTTEMTLSIAASTEVASYSNVNFPTTTITLIVSPILVKPTSEGSSRSTVTDTIDKSHVPITATGMQASAATASGVAGHSSVLSSVINTHTHGPVMWTSTSTQTRTTVIETISVASGAASATTLVKTSLVTETIIVFPSIQPVAGNMYTMTETLSGNVMTTTVGSEAIVATEAPGGYSAPVLSNLPTVTYTTHMKSTLTSTVATVRNTVSVTATALAGYSDWDWTSTARYTEVGSSSPSQSVVPTATVTIFGDNGGNKAQTASAHGAHGTSTATTTNRPKATTGVFTAAGAMSEVNVNGLGLGLMAVIMALVM